MLDRDHTHTVSPVLVNLNWAKPVEYLLNKAFTNMRMKVYASASVCTIVHAERKTCVKVECSTGLENSKLSVSVTSLPVVWDSAYEARPQLSL